MNSAILSRPACNALRGLAIIGIFLHNYCHWLGPIVKENEYQYFQHNVDWLIFHGQQPRSDLSCILTASAFSAGVRALSSCTM